MHSSSVMAAVYPNRKFTLLLQRGPLFYVFNSIDNSLSANTLKGYSRLWPKNEYFPCSWDHNLEMVTSGLENDLHRHSEISDQMWLTSSGSLFVEIRPRKLESAQVNAAWVITRDLGTTLGKFVPREAHFNPNWIEIQNLFTF